MFNPLLKFDPRLIPRLRGLKYRYLISQSYPRGRQPHESEERVPLLMTQYEDRGLALTHLDALQKGIKDRFAALLDLEHEPHLKRLLAILQPDSKYNVFIHFIENQAKMDQLAKELFKQHLADYIAQHTTWKLNRNTKLLPKLQLIFGRWFVEVRFGGQSRTIPLEDIENT